MKFSPEWMSCEDLLTATLERPRGEPRPRAPYAYHEWAYHPDLGLLPRESADGGSALSNDVVALFNVLWRSEVAPSPADLRELANVEQFSSDELVGTAVPRYWRCKLRKLVAEGLQPYYVVETCKQVGPRMSFTASLHREPPKDIAERIEPVQPMLLYDVSKAPRTGDRAAVFVETALDGSKIVVHTERVGVLPNLPPAVGGPEPQQVEYESIDEALAGAGIGVRQLGLVGRRDPAISLREVVEHEAALRGVSLRQVAEDDDGIRFEGATSRFAARSFAELRDILRWHTGGF